VNGGAWAGCGHIFSPTVRRAAFSFWIILKGLREGSESLQAAVDQFLPEPLRELSAVAKLPPIAALSADGFLAVNLHVTTGGATQVLSKRK